MFEKVSLSPGNVLRLFSVTFCLFFLVLLISSALFAESDISIEQESLSEGTVLFDADFYFAPDTTYITVEDSDLDVTGGPDNATVSVISNTDCSEIITLTETGNSTGVFTGSILLEVSERKGLSDGSGKFLGNVMMGGKSGYTIPSNFDIYWNQVTPEDTGKWGSVEATRDVMNWSGLDQAYNYAKENGFPFRQHTLVWGQQQPGWLNTTAIANPGWLNSLSSENFQVVEPSWLSSLPQDEQREEVEEWIRLFGERYPDTDYIDVVNEPLNAPPSYKNALGGDGSTGWDWVIWCFQKARQYCPNAKLHINEYNVIEGWASMADYLEIINLLKDRGLIDGIGNQCHHFQLPNMTTVDNNLDTLGATGLPVYITELDIDLADDAEQLGEYQTDFPVLWEHPAVEGITFWGYIEGRIWQPNGYLIRDDGTERPALVWLKEYFSLPDGVLQVNDGDIITVTYEDAADGSDNPATLTDTALISLVSAPTGIIATAGRTYVFLVWDSQVNPAFTGYNVYRSTSLAGTKTKLNTTLVTESAYQDISLSPGTTYYYWITAVEDTGNETGFSNSIIVTTTTETGGEDDNDDGNDVGSVGASSSDVGKLSGCFIATACYGTPMAEEVLTLSAFRDKYLLDNSLGRFFVKTYYKFSPEIASFISEHPYLKNVVRWSLKPVVKVADKILE